MLLHKTHGKQNMDMEIALPFVVLAVMDCPVRTHSLADKIPLHGSI